MIRRDRAPSLAAVAIVIAALSGACGGGSGAKTATPARSASPAATPNASATPSLGIRTLDLSKLADVRDLEASTGGSYLQTSAIYADLTGDGIDEAVVPIASGGTLGDLAFLVLTPSELGARTVLKVAPADGAGGLSVAIVADQLVMTRPVYGPEDPNCCPGALRRTTYAWDGTAFSEQSVTIEPNPAGGGKRTAVPVQTPP